MACYHLLIDGGQEQTLTEPQLDKVIELVYYCEECSNATTDIFHLKSAEQWADIDTALGD